MDFLEIMKKRGYQEVLQDNDLMLDWILHYGDVKEWVKRIEALKGLLLEEFNDDWCDFIDSVKESLDNEDNDDSEDAVTFIGVFTDDDIEECPVCDGYGCDFCAWDGWV